MYECILVSLLTDWKNDWFFQELENLRKGQWISFLTYVLVFQLLGILIEYFFIKNQFLLKGWSTILIINTWPDKMILRTWLNGYFWIIIIVYMIEFDCFYNWSYSCVTIIPYNTLNSYFDCINMILGKLIDYLIIWSELL